MKRGAAPKFKELGSSPGNAKQKADELLAYTKERSDLEEKIQTLQAKGLIPGTQEFNKKVQTASDLRKFSDLEKYDDDQ